MNLINPEAVDAFCAEVALRARSEPLRGWAQRNVRNHVLRDAALHAPVRPQDVPALVESGELAGPPDWLDAAVARGDRLGLFRPDGEAARALARELGRVVDHRNAVPAEMTRVSVPEAIAAAGQWEAEQARQRVAAFAAANGLDAREATALLARHDPRVASLWPDDPAHLRPLAESAGHRLVEILCRPALEREGTLMDHCVATYWHRVEAGETRILSLRSPDNLPLATLEVAPLTRRGAGAARIIQAHLPKDLQVAWQIRGISNARPAPGAVPVLEACLAQAGIAASPTEIAWAGLSQACSAYARLRLGDMALAMPAEAARDRASGAGPSAAFVTAMRLLLRRLDELDGEAATALAQSLLPAPGDLGREEEVVAQEPRAVRVTWRVPNLLLTSALAPLLARAPGTAHAALSGLARRIIDGVASEPLAAHRIEPALGRWPDPLPFFAWCGLAQEWTEASRAADLRRREHLREQAALLRRRLRAPELAAQERSRLMNAVNVQIPRLLGGA